MTKQFNDITSHPIQSYRGEDLYGAENEELKRLQDALVNLKYKELSYLQDVQLGNKGFIGYEAIENPGFSKILTIEGLDYGTSRYDNTLLVNPTYADIQNKRAEELTGFNKVMAGIGKGAVLAGTSFLSGLSIFGYGLPLVTFSKRKDAEGNDLTMGLQWSKLWDNEITRFLKSINDGAEEIMPNYYTTQEQENPLGHLFSANFLGDKLIKNIGYMVGAFYSGNVIGAVTKFTRLPALMSKITGRLSTAKNTMTAVGAFSSAVGEGSIEALNNSVDWAKGKTLEINDYYNGKIQELATSNLSELEKQYQLNLLEQQKLQELKQVELEKARMGNMNLLLNIPILTASNVMLFARLYSGGYNAQRAVYNAVNKANQGTGKLVAKALGKSFITEGSEEFLQRAASTTSGYFYNNNLEEFRRSWIDPAANKNASDFLSNILSSTAQALSDTIKDPTAIEEFLVGGISGMLGMPSFGRANTRNAWIGKDKMIGLSEGVVGQYQKLKAERDRATKYTNLINTWLQDKKYVDYFRGLSALTFYDGKLQQNIDDKNIFEFKNNELNQLVSQIITFSNVGKLGDLEAMVKESLSDLTDADLEAIYNDTLKNGISPFNVNGESPLLTSEGKQAMRNKLEKSKNEILKVIKDYRTVSENLDIQYGEELSDEQLAELSWMYTSIENFKDRKLDTYKDFIPALREIIKSKDNISSEVIKDLESKGLIKEMYKRHLQEPNTSKIIYQNDKKIIIQRGDKKTTYELESPAEVTTNKDGSFTVDFVTSKKPIAGKYTVVKTGVASFVDDLIDLGEKSREFLDKLSQIIDGSPEKAERIADNEDIYEFLLVINDLYNKNTNKEETALKIKDYVKLHKMQNAFALRAEDYVKNPGKAAEEIEELKKKVTQEEANKQKKENKEKLKNAKTLKEFKSIIENLDADTAKEILKDLVLEGNNLAITYDKISDYVVEVRRTITNFSIDPSIRQHGPFIKEVALEMFNKYFSNNANTLEDITDPNKVNNINVQLKDILTLLKLPQGNIDLYTHYAKYIIQQAILNANKKEAFKLYIKDTHQKADNLVDKPIIDNEDFSETPKVDTIDYNGQDVFKYVQGVINDLNIEENDKESLLDNLAELEDTLKSILEYSLIEKAQKLIDTIYDDLGNNKSIDTKVASDINTYLTKELENKKKEFKDVEIQDTPFEEVRKDNSSVSTDALPLKEKDPHKYYVPTMLEYYNNKAVPNTSNSTFTDELKAHIKAIHKYLTDIGAFAYVDLNKLKIGEDVFFIIDTSISDNSEYAGLNPETIFMAVKKPDGSYQIIGSLQDLPGAISKFKGLETLISDIKTEYADYIEKNKDNTDFNPRFVFSKTSKVNSTKTGHLVYTENKAEISLALILNNTSNAFKNGLLFGVMRNGLIVVPGEPNLVMQDWVSDKTNREGRVYMLIPTNKTQITYNGELRVYYPVALRVTRFTKESLGEETITQYKLRLKELVELYQNNNADFNKPSESITDNILKIVVSLSHAKNKNEVIALRNKLSNYLYLYYNSAENDFDVNFDFFETKETKAHGISISRYPVVRDANGIRLNVQDRKLSTEGLNNDGKVYFTELRSLDDVLNRAEQLMDIILQLNLGINVKRVGLNILNTSKIDLSQVPIVKEGFLTSDVQKAEVVNSWFSIDYYENGKFVPAEVINGLNHSQSISSNNNTVTDSKIVMIDGIEYEIKNDGIYINNNKLAPVATLYVTYFTENVKADTLVVLLNGEEFYYVTVPSQDNKGLFIKKNANLEQSGITLSLLLISLKNDENKFNALKNALNLNMLQPVGQLQISSSNPINEETNPSKDRTLSDIIEKDLQYIPEGVSYTTKKGATGKVHHKIYEFQYEGNTVQVFLDGSETKLLLGNNRTVDIDFLERLDSDELIKLRYIMPDGSSVGMMLPVHAKDMLTSVIVSIDRNKPNILPPQSPIPPIDNTDAGVAAVNDILGLFREIDTSLEEFEIWDLEKELAWLKKNLPQMSDKTRLEIIKGLIPIMRTGRKAWGRYRKGIITLSDIAAKGTLYHESFHYVFDMLLSELEKIDILKEAKLKFGNKSLLELEEDLAESFREYTMLLEELVTVKNKEVTLGLKILDFFKSLFIKITHLNKSLDALDLLFADINSSKYANAQPVVEYIRTKESLLETYSQEVYTLEMLDIKNKAIADGTFMKAPNGNPTNLTERLWLHVRTKAFKNWFGDWEKVYKEQKRVKDFKEQAFFTYKNVDGETIRATAYKMKNGDYRFIFKHEDGGSWDYIAKAEYVKLKGLDGVISSLNDNTDVQKSTPEEYLGKSLDRFIKTNASKVVDENGEPLVVYHGSKKQFNTFDYREVSNLEGGFYFTSDKKYAENYGTILYPVFLNIKNPIYNDNINKNTVEDIIISDAQNKFKDPSYITYDGIVGKDTITGEFKYTSKGKEYVILDSPNQVKSATDNTGEYSLENNDIRYREIGINTQEELNRAYFSKRLFTFLDTSLQLELLDKGITELLYDSFTIEEQEYIRNCVGY